MGPCQPLSTPKAAEFAAISRCGQHLAAATPEPGLRRTGATFLPRCSLRGKACGHSTNHLTLSWASWRRQTLARQRSGVLWHGLGTWGGPRRNRGSAV